MARNKRRTRPIKITTEGYRYKPNGEPYERPVLLSKREEDHVRSMFGPPHMTRHGLLSYADDTANHPAESGGNPGYSGGNFGNTGALGGNLNSGSVQAGTRGGVTNNTSSSKGTTSSSSSGGPSNYGGSSSTGSNSNNQSSSGKMGSNSTQSGGPTNYGNSKPSGSSGSMANRGNVASSMGSKSSTSNSSTSSNNMGTRGGVSASMNNNTGGTSGGSIAGPTTGNNAVGSTGLRGTTGPEGQYTGDKVGDVALARTMAKAVSGLLGPAPKVQDRIAPEQTDTSRLLGTGFDTTNPVGLVKTPSVKAITDRIAPTNTAYNDTPYQYSGPSTRGALPDISNPKSPYGNIVQGDSTDPYGTSSYTPPHGEYSEQATSPADIQSPPMVRPDVSALNNVPQQAPMQRPDVSALNSTPAPNWEKIVNDLTGTPSLQLPAPSTPNQVRPDVSALNSILQASPMVRPDVSALNYPTAQVPNLARPDVSALNNIPQAPSMVRPDVSALNNIPQTPSMVRPDISALNSPPAQVPNLSRPDISALNAAPKLNQVRPDVSALNNIPDQFPDPYTNPYPISTNDRRVLASKDQSRVPTDVPSISDMALPGDITDVWNDMAGYNPTPTKTIAAENLPPEDTRTSLASTVDDRHQYDTIQRYNARTAQNAPVVADNSQSPTVISPKVVSPQVQQRVLEKFGTQEGKQIIQTVAAIKAIMAGSKGSVSSLMRVTKKRPPLLKEYA